MFDTLVKSSWTKARAHDATIRVLVVTHSSAAVSYSCAHMA